MSEMPDIEPSPFAQNDLRLMDILGRLESAVSDPVVMEAAEPWRNSVPHAMGAKEGDMAYFLTTLRAGGYHRAGDPVDLPARILKACIEKHEESPDGL